jgi:uncharacterized RmlC-like cupin family protein
MDIQDIARALAALPHVLVEASDNDAVFIYVPAITDGIHLNASNIEQCRSIFAPTGDPALQLAVKIEELVYPLIVTDTDIVFAPASTESQLDSPIQFNVSNAPHLVAYTEMQRDAEGIATLCETSTSWDAVSLGASFLLLRCFIAGAMRLGGWPARTMAFWQHGWKIAGDNLFLPDFRADSAWDALANEAASIVVMRADGSPNDDAVPSETINRSAFEALALVMRVAQLDEEFLTAWSTWLPIGPAKFRELLTRGLPTATFDIALYPTGGGSVDLRVEVDGVLQALLQLRFLSSERVMYLDEIFVADVARGSGLFQRLLFNAERLGAALGMKELQLLASGVGAYALAVAGRYPRDLGLFTGIK